MKAIGLTIFILTIFITSLCYGQIEDSNSKTKNELPEYIGGSDQIGKIFNENLKYPEEALKDSISGIVYVSLWIETNGSISDIKIIKGLRQDLDNEAIRLVKLLNNWKPGKQNGKSIRLNILIPVNFKISK
jgi:periplasmic protein TonB